MPAEPVAQELPIALPSSSSSELMNIAESVQTKKISYAKVVPILINKNLGSTQIQQWKI
jgi:hypothetical protein